MVDFILDPFNSNDAEFWMFFVVWESNLFSYFGIFLSILFRLNTYMTHARNVQKQPHFTTYYKKSQPDTLKLLWSKDLSIGRKALVTLRITTNVSRAVVLPPRLHMGDNIGPLSLFPSASANVLRSWAKECWGSELA